jgi:glycosyltransferase involved in cell wall biosynthesis
MLGGMERQTHLLARNLVARGHRVRVLTARFPGLGAHEMLDGVEIERLQLGSGDRWTRMGGYLARLAAALLAQRDFAQLVQVQQTFYPAAAAALATLPLRVPLVVSNRGSGPEGGVALMRSLPLGRVVLQLLRRRATCIVTNDEMEQEMREEGFAKLVRIPNGVEMPVLDAEARAEARRALGLSGNVVLFLARLEPVKRVALLLRAWASGPRPGATLLIVGEGAERPLVERAAKEAAPDRLVRFDGPTTDPSRYFRAADLFVLPSITEGLSNALLEALAHGVPAIGSDISGNRQILSREDLGLLFPSENEAALSMAIARLLAAPDEAKRLGSLAREHVAQNFSVEAMVSAHEQLYRRLLRSENS